jgi:hypothetical protein
LGATGAGPGAAAARGAVGGGDSARRYATRGRDAREREKREKERAGPGIVAYVHRADTSANEHKRTGLRDGRGTFVGHPMNISYIRWFKNRRM